METLRWQAGCSAPLFAVAPCTVGRVLLLLVAGVVLAAARPLLLGMLRAVLASALAVLFGVVAVSVAQPRVDLVLVRIAPALVALALAGPIRLGVLLALFGAVLALVVEVLVAMCCLVLAGVLAAPLLPLLLPLVHRSASVRDLKAKFLVRSLEPFGVVVDHRDHLANDVADAGGAHMPSSSE